MTRLPLWRLRTGRRKLFEFFGSRRYSRPCSESLLNGILKHVRSPGVFVEAGAVDGFFESNTYYLEQFLSWKGVLVEPDPRMYARLKVNRPRATTFNCALVSKDYTDASISIRPAHALTRIEANAASHDALVVPARTLDWVLDQSAVKEVDLLSLDVEGYEIEALKGLTMHKCRPKFLLVECLDKAAKMRMDEFLDGRYDCIEELTYRDYLYAAYSDEGPSR